MGLRRWFTQNVADTDGDTHSDVVPLDLSVDRDEALRRVPEVIGKMPRWRVEDVEPRTGTIRATRRTRVMRYVDDVTLRVESAGPGVRVHARSKSRVGKGDLGQNRRNLHELFRALRTQMGPS